jgi:membrane-bound lytic murein transglycosylase B
MRQRGILVGIGVILAAIVLCVAIVVVLAPRIPFISATPTPPAPTWASPAAPPVAAAERWRKGWAGRVDEAWLARTAAATGIPARALAAYAGAVLAKGKDGSHCAISWNTLAAIGYVESKHGTFAGSSVADDGTVSPPIFGVALDGGATEHIADTDNGAIDGDTDFDRAVGPMQLIPQSWKNWHVDASGDGKEDPQNIDDASLATANYLCRSGGDLTTESGWRTAVASYNSAPAYLALVARVGDDYATATLQ